MSYVSGNSPSEASPYRGTDDRMSLVIHNPYYPEPNWPWRFRIFMWALCNMYDGYPEIKKAVREKHPVLAVLGG